jgi:O-antigen ligase
MSNARENIKVYALSAIAFCLPAFPQALPFLVVILLLEWLTNKELKKNFLLAVSNTYSLLLMALYLLYVVGLLYTENILAGISDLETKATLFIFPLVFAGIKKLNLQRILNSFIIGIIAAVIFCFIIACYKYFNSEIKDAAPFLSSNFSYFLHPSYFSMYIVFALVLIFKRLFFLERKYFEKILLVFICLCLSITVFLLSSKMGIISFLLIAGLFPLVFGVQQKKYLQTGFFILFLVSLTYFGFQRLPHLGLRFENAKKAFFQDEDVYLKDGSALRMKSWETTFKLFRDNLWTGVGTGDFKDELIDLYHSTGLTYAAERKLNAHNQFLQTAGTLGIVGLILLLLNFLFPFFYSVRRKNLIYFFFLLLLFMNLMVESMFERQAGVIFFAFFNSLFLLTIDNNKDFASRKLTFE